MHELNRYPIMRSYALFKFEFECETYLNAVRDRRYRNAISIFRLGSHNLEIEGGRHCNHKVPVSERLCFRCKCIENEQHFLFRRQRDREKFVCLMCLMNSRYNNVLAWLGKFLYTAQRVRGGHHTWVLGDIWQSCIKQCVFIYDYRRQLSGSYGGIFVSSYLYQRQKCAMMLLSNLALSCI